MKFLGYILRNARRNPVRSLLTVASIAVCLFLMMILVSFFAISDEVNASTRVHNRVAALNANGFAGAIPIARVKEIAELDGVVALERALDVTPLPAGGVGRNAELCRMGAEALGASNAPIARNAGDVVCCASCPTGCSIYVDHNKDIVYRLRARYNPKAQGHFMCDDGRYGYHHANSGERFVRPAVKTEGRFKPATWNVVLQHLKQESADAAKAPSLIPT